MLGQAIIIHRQIATLTLICTNNCYLTIQGSIYVANKLFFSVT